MLKVPKGGSKDNMRYGPYLVPGVSRGVITARCSPTLGGEVPVAFEFVKCFQFELVDDYDEDTIEEGDTDMLKAAYRCAGVSGARVAAHHRPHSRAHSSPTMRASHAVMEPRPMIHRGKRASCRCLEKPPGRSRYGCGSSCGGHSRVPPTTRREAAKSLSARGGGGGQLPSAAMSHPCTRATALRGSRRSCSSRWLRSSHGKSPSRSMWSRKPSTEVAACYGAGLSLCLLGHQPRAEDFRPCGARGAPRGQPQGFVLVHRLAVVGPKEP